LCFFNWFIIDYGGRHWVTYYNYKANGQIRTEYWDPLGNDQLFYGLTWPYSIIDSNHWQIMHSRATTCGAHGKNQRKSLNSVKISHSIFGSVIFLLASQSLSKPSRN